VGTATDKPRRERTDRGPGVAQDQPNICGLPPVELAVDRALFAADAERTVGQGRRVPGPERNVVGEDLRRRVDGSAVTVNVGEQDDPDGPHIVRVHTGQIGKFIADVETVVVPVERVGRADEVQDVTAAPGMALGRREDAGLPQHRVRGVAVLKTDRGRGVVVAVFGP